MAYLTPTQKDMLEYNIDNAKESLENLTYLVENILPNENSETIDLTNMSEVRERVSGYTVDIHKFTNRIIEQFEEESLAYK